MRRSSWSGELLSRDELADLVEVDDVEPLLADLERRGLVRDEGRRRTSLLAAVELRIRSTAEALAAGDRLLGYLTVLARGGRLTPQRLAEETEALLGLCGWAAEMQKWTELLELVKTVQACFEIAKTVEQWIPLGEHALRAARALGDRQSEAWALDALSDAYASIGDPAPAERYRREADELQLAPGPAPNRPVPARAAGRGRAAVWAAGVIVAAAAGLGLGFVVGDKSSTASTTTVEITRGGTNETVTETTPSETTTVNGTTTVVSTETSTAFSTTTETSTETATTTETVKTTETVTEPTTVTVTVTTTAGPG